MIGPRAPRKHSAPSAPHILDVDASTVESLLSAHAVPSFHATQVLRWLHVHNVLDSQRMTDLPAGVRALLAQAYDCRPLKLKAKQASGDGSVKYGWLSLGGHPVEAVLMPRFDYGTALCVSVHSGCPLSCRFCGTGRLGLLARLGPAEILMQLYLAEADSRLSVDRLLFMGMGEPLLALPAVARTIAVLTDKRLRAWSARRITLSTVGLPERIIECADTLPRVNLALSLHFTTEEGRTAHMPGAEASPARLAEALLYYRQVNGGKLTIEYMLLDGLNDTDADVGRLVRFARLAGLPRDSEVVAQALSHPAPPHQQPLPLLVNLIEYNPIPGAAYRPSPPARMNTFAKALRDAGVRVTVRHSRGRDIAAACGMLGGSLAARRA